MFPTHHELWGLISEPNFRSGVIPYVWQSLSRKNSHSVVSLERRLPRVMRNPPPLSATLAVPGLVCLVTTTPTMSSHSTPLGKAP